MINAIQHSIICETLTIWAAEFAAGCPSVHETIYEILSMLALEFEACAAAVTSALNSLPEIEEAAEECEEICAELVSLEPAIGLAGAIVPVAGIRNHELDHSTVFRCRVQHWGITDYLGLHRGCTVTLRKEMGKSPELFSCMETGRTAGSYSPLHGKWVPPVNHALELFVRPETCPYCGRELVLRVDSSGHESIACVNAECKTQVGDRVVRFVTVGGMGIPGITVGVVEQLLMEGKLETVESLYTLTVKDFMDACHVSYTDAYVLMKSVERSKLKPMHMLLDAMGIPGISREITPALAACITDAGGMGALVDDDPGVTARAVSRFTARSIRVGLPAKAVKQVIDYMVAHRDMVLAFVRMGVAQKSVPLVVEDKPKRSKGRKMKRRKPRKKPGEHGSA